MCDHGRLETFKSVNSDNRIDGPYLRREGTLQKVGWDEAFASASSQLKQFDKDEIAFIGSAFATCEDNYVFGKFANSVIGSKHLDFMRHINSEFGDKILRKNDVTPNTMGTELVGVSPLKGGLDFNGIIQGINDGKIKALYLIEDDIISANPDFENVLAKLNLFIVHSTNFNRTTELADLVFPAATYAEKNGPMVNYQGRVQRLMPAVSTVEMDRSLEGMSMSRLDKFGTRFDRWAKGNKHDARSTWKIIAGLASTLGGKFKFNMAEEVFNEMSKKVDAFKGLDYDVIGDKGAMLKTGVAEKA
jgi:NADH-quinone oxidoreductase subunit G